MKSEVIQLYDNRDDVTLTTYILDDSPETRCGQPRPAVLICPGGAYLSNCTSSKREIMDFLWLTRHLPEEREKFSRWYSHGFRQHITGCRKDLPMKSRRRPRWILRWKTDRHKSKIVFRNEGETPSAARGITQRRVFFQNVLWYAIK